MKFQKLAEEAEQPLPGQEDLFKAKVFEVVSQMTSLKAKLLTDFNDLKSPKEEMFQGGMAHLDKSIQSFVAMTEIPKEVPAPEPAKVEEGGVNPTEPAKQEVPAPAPKAAKYYDVRKASNWLETLKVILEGAGYTLKNSIAKRGSFRLMYKEEMIGSLSTNYGASFELLDAGYQAHYDILKPLFEKAGFDVRSYPWSMK